MLFAGVKGYAGTSETVIIPVQSIDKAPCVTMQTSAYQGDTVEATVNTDVDLKNPILTFKGKKIKLACIDKKTYRAYIGINAWEKTEKYEIKFSDDTEKLSQTKFLTVVTKKFPNQYIKLSPSKSALEPTKFELAQVQKGKTSCSCAPHYGSVPFISPVPGEIVSVYGLNRYYNGKIGSYHKGVDIAANEGAPVKVVADGIVTVADTFNIHGGTIAVDHGNGITSMYLHLSKICAKPGQTVKAGNIIGNVGSTGISTGPHLHWGIYVNGESVDPYTFWVRK